MFNILAIFSLFSPIIFFYLGIRSAQRQAERKEEELYVDSSL